MPLHHPGPIFGLEVMIANSSSTRHECLYTKGGESYIAARREMSTRGLFDVGVDELEYDRISLAL
jgi:hypothetical protein